MQNLKVRKINDIEEKSFKVLIEERFKKPLSNDIIDEIKLGIPKILNKEETAYDLKKRLIQLILPDLSVEKIEDILDITIYADITLPVIRTGVIKP
ncbi:MAG: hypothetical protein ACFE9T_08880 [Promethearchaeota archaeon]